MKLTIKTLDQKTFHLDFDESKTVWDLKAHLCKLPEVGVRPEQQQLIYAGRVLANENELRSYSIDERKFLVVMAKKLPTDHVPAAKKDDKEPPLEKKDGAKPTESVDHQPGPSTRRANEAAKPQQQQKAPAQAAKVKQNAPLEAAAAATAAVAAIQVPSTPGNMLAAMELPPTGGTDDELVVNIMSMGYAEAEVRRALIASFNNPDRAIEYLIDGIPEFPDMLAQPAETPPDAVNPLGFLRDDPRFAQMRRVIQQRPEMLSMVLAKIGEANPQLLAVIREHQEEFVRMINEGDDALETEIGEEVVEVVLTEAERLAVERLVALGFPRQIVVQAYIACEKNEEQTADFLCRHMEDN